MTNSSANHSFESDLFSNSVDLVWPNESKLIKYHLKLETAQGIVQPKMNICRKCTRTIQDADEFVSSLEQILRN